ncbi:MAG: hypothetical protein KY476_24070 [Planctomycetes bacterium]|nr:hypothetical protein [Planctomycetota bacterium]
MPETDLDHPQLGRLRYKSRKGWSGWIELPLFAHFKLANGKSDEADPTANEPDDEFSTEGVSESPGEERRDVVRITIGDAGGGVITAAQQRTVDFLLMRENRVLKAAVREIYEQFTSSAGEQPLGNPLDEILRHTDSRSLLAGQIEFSELSLGVDAVEGHVPVLIRYACTWDEEHGGEVELLRDQPYEHCAQPGLPWKLPPAIAAPDTGGAQHGRRRVELRIHGRWSGFFMLDAAGDVIGIDRRCPV